MNKTCIIISIQFNWICIGLTKNTFESCATFPNRFIAITNAFLIPQFDKNPILHLKKKLFDCHGRY